MIKHVRITNFKSLGDVSVDLDPVTVVIGQSGTGKSNFFDALRFLRDCVKSLNAQFAADTQGGWARIKPVTANGQVSLSFSLRFTGPLDDYSYFLAFHPGLSDQVKEEKLTLGKRVLFHRDAGRWIEAPTVVSPPPPNLGTPVLGAITGVREITRAHLLMGDGLSFFGFSDDVLLAPGRQPDRQTGLTKSGDNFLTNTRCDRYGPTGLGSSAGDGSSAKTAKSVD
jgi:hypothetical protein